MNNDSNHQHLLFLRSFRCEDQDSHRHQESGGLYKQFLSSEFIGMIRGHNKCDIVLILGY